MFIVKDFSVQVKTLKEDTFNLLVTLQKHMTSKSKDKDYAPYHNYAKTNLDFWGDGYKLISEIVKLPPSKRDKVDYILIKEMNGESAIYFYYNQKSYNFFLYRKNSAHIKMIDRINEIFKVEDENRIVIKKWKQLTYLMS
jgi:hypothetical protein